MPIFAVLILHGVTIKAILLLEGANAGTLMTVGTLHAARRQGVALGLPLPMACVRQLAVLEL